MPVFRASLSLSRLRLPRTRRPFRLTAGGWVFILYTIGVGAGAINTGNNLLYLVFGVFLGLILASGLLSDLTLWGVSAEPEFPVSVEAGLPALLPLKVRNTKRSLSSVSVSIETECDLRGEQIRLRAFVPFLRSGQSEIVYLRFVPSQRGRFQLNRITATTIYPFGLLKKRWLFREMSAAPVEFLVYPSPVPVTAAFLERFAPGMESDSERSRSGEGPSITGLREFRPGDNPRRIHWKASAKRAREEGTGWLLRDTDREEQREAVLSWPDPVRTAGFRSASAELFVRFVGSVLRGLQHDGIRARLRVPSDVTRSVAVDEQKQVAWGFLALWDAERPFENPYLARFEPESSDEDDPGLDLLELFEQWKAEETAAAPETAA